MQENFQIDHDEAQRCEYNRKTLHRIHRVQGQLAALERMIEADEGTCEARVIQARAIEKGMTSLITHLVACYLDNTARFDMEQNPEQTTEDLKRIFDLLNH
ncbi:MAG: metal-sensitive transcriptional regulator [Anaerolineae bacterium]|nr:metal-sensitive transcriptional regulator [Anaerolineae bacterium]